MMTAKLFVIIWLGYLINPINSTGNLVSIEILLLISLFLRIYYSVILDLLV